MDRYSQGKIERGALPVQSSVSQLRNKSKDFEAIKNLKLAESQLDLMKRRLSALKIKDDKNNRKAEAAMKKIKYHRYVQDLEQRQRDRKEIHHRDMSQRLELQRNLNSAERSERRSKLRQVRRELQESKAGCYELEKKASKEIETKIKALNQSEIQNRKRMRQSVRQLQEKSKRNYRIFQLEKSRAIRSHRDLEHSRMSQMQEKRHLQMQQLARLQIQMLERQSRSRQAVDETMKELNYLIPSRRTVKNKIATSSDTGNSTPSNPEEFYKF